VTEQEIQILNQIISLNGNCLGNLCETCPFRNRCHSEFILDKWPSKEKRAAIALDALTNLLILEDEEVEWRHKVK